MPSKNTTLTGAVLWVFAVCAAGVLGHLTSPSAWAVLAALAALPPLVTMRLWNDPAPSMSESIQKVLR